MIELYTAEWCSACKSLKKTLEGMDTKVTLVDIDTPEGSEKARGLGVRGIPMLYDTETEKRIIGAVSKQKLEDFINS